MEAPPNAWIVRKPEVLVGKPCIRGTRISVEFVLELLASGARPDEILSAYPQVTRDGLVAAFEYAAAMMRGEQIWDVKSSA